MRNRRKQDKKVRVRRWPSFSKNIRKLGLFNSVSRL